GDFFLHEGICDTARKITFAGADSPPKQIADILIFHGIPMLRIETGSASLWVLPVVILKSPFPHGGVDKAPAFQFFHGVKVPAAFLGGLPFLTCNSLAVA